MSSPSPSDSSRRNSPQPAVSSPALAQRPRLTRRSDSNAAGNTAIPDEDHGVDIPLTMSASVVLAGLPQDAHRALADAEAIDVGKGVYSTGQELFLIHFFSWSRSFHVYTGSSIDWELTLIFIVTVRFQPLPSAPILRKTVFKISASQKFETVVNFLRKKLDCQDTDSVFCYINNVFAPSLDEGIGGLYRVIIPFWLRIKVADCWSSVSKTKRMTSYGSNTPWLHSLVESIQRRFHFKRPTSPRIY